jgi:phosphohistidine phosphatase
MQLYILRHSDADTEAKNDDDRYLSEKGILQSQRAARFCEAHELVPALILSSPIRRAHQTAKFISEHLRVEMRLVRWLACGAQPATVLTELYDYRALPSLMIVGHEPDLSQLTAHLIGAAQPESIHIRKGSLTQLTVFELKPNSARLECSIPAKLM